MPFEEGGFVFVPIVLAENSPVAHSVATKGLQDFNVSQFLAGPRSDAEFSDFELNWLGSWCSGFFHFSFR